MKYDHTHKYMRVRMGKKADYIVYKCMAMGLDCPHYLRPELVVGRKTICWRCGNEIVMTSPMAKMKKPHCIDCTAQDGRGANFRADSDETDLGLNEGISEAKVEDSGEAV